MTVACLQCRVSELKYSDYLLAIYCTNAVALRFHLMKYLIRNSNFWKYNRLSILLFSITCKIIKKLTDVLWISTLSARCLVCTCETILNILSLLFYINMMVAIKFENVGKKLLIVL